MNIILQKHFYKGLFMTESPRNSKVLQLIFIRSLTYISLHFKLFWPTLILMMRRKLPMARDSHHVCVYNNFLKFLVLGHVIIFNVYVSSITTISLWSVQIYCRRFYLQCFLSNVRTQTNSIVNWTHSKPPRVSTQDRLLLGHPSEQQTRPMLLFISQRRDPLHKGLLKG